MIAPTYLANYTATMHKQLLQHPDRNIDPFGRRQRTTGRILAAFNHCP